MAKELSYLEKRRQMKLDGPKPEALKRAEKKAKGVYFANQIEKAPLKCEECGVSLAGTKAINPAAIVAHVLKKSKVKSVANDPLNTIYLCGDHHDMFDNGGEKKVKAMKIYEKARHITKLLLPNIPESERRYIPKYFLPEWE